MIAGGEKIEDSEGEVTSRYLNGVESNERLIGTKPASMSQVENLCS